MRSGKPSRTAQVIAFQRAVGNLAPQVPGFSDPLAVECLPDKWQKKIAATARSVAVRPDKSPFPFWMRGMGVFNQFRTVVFDRAIAAAGPLPQLVTLGAGFDTRAWRLDAVRDAIVFEVDHPATQAVKRQRAAGWQPKGREVRFVATDFRQDDLARMLGAAGFDQQQPAFWLWEGVAMYLRPAEVTANLAAFAALSAAGSRVAMTYLTKDRGRPRGSLFLALIGEPMRSAYTPEEMRRTARECGWKVISDTGIEDWLPEMTPGLRLTKRQVGLQWLERILVAEKSS